MGAQVLTGSGEDDDDVDEAGVGEREMGEANAGVAGSADGADGAAEVDEETFLGRQVISELTTTVRGLGMGGRGSPAEEVAEEEGCGSGGGDLGSTARAAPWDEFTQSSGARGIASQRGGVAFVVGGMSPPAAAPVVKRGSRANSGGRLPRATAHGAQTLERAPAAARATGGSGSGSGSSGGGSGGGSSCVSAKGGDGGGGGGEVGSSLPMELLENAPSLSAKIETLRLYLEQQLGGPAALERVYSYCAREDCGSPGGKGTEERAEILAFLHARGVMPLQVLLGCCACGRRRRRDRRRSSSRVMGTSCCCGHNHV